jgi:branched-chain amino acid transport system permease protein
MSIRRHLPILVLILAVVAVQFLTSAFGATYYLTQLTMSAYYALVVIGLCLLLGYCGQISIGQAGFFAIGGYTTAFLTTRNLIEAADQPMVSFLATVRMLTFGQDGFGNETLYFSPWFACLAAILITAAVAYLIGTPVLKLRGHYLAMATLGFGTIVYRVVLGTRALGEADGIVGVPPFRIAGGLAVSGSFSARVPNYYIAWVLVIVGLVVISNLIASRVGRALRSLHGSEEASAAMGVNTARYKLNVFVMGAVFAAIGGVFMTHYNGGIGPSEASVIKSVRYVAIVAAGGMANLWGALGTGVVLNFLSLRGVFGSYDDAVFGSILIIIMILAPQGLLSSAVLREVRSLLGRIRNWRVRRNE